MKKFMIILAALFALTTANAQVSKETQKEVNAARKEASAKAAKNARSEAKKLKKEGWLAFEGTLPLEKQLDESYTLQSMKDEDYTPKYFIGNGTYSTDDKGVALKYAMDAARMDIAEQLEIQLAEQIENTVGSSEGTAITKALAASKSVVKNKLSGTQPVVRMYRKTKDGQYEVQVVLPYSTDKARKVAKSILREQLASEGEALQKKLDEVKF